MLLGFARSPDRRAGRRRNGSASAAFTCSRTCGRGLRIRFGSKLSLTRAGESGKRALPAVGTRALLRVLSRARGPGSHGRWRQNAPRGSPACRGSAPAATCEPDQPAAPVIGVIAGEVGRAAARPPRGPSVGGDREPPERPRRARPRAAARRAISRQNVRELAASQLVARGAEIGEQSFRSASSTMDDRGPRPSIRMRRHRPTGSGNERQRRTGGDRRRQMGGARHVERGVRAPARIASPASDIVEAPAAAACARSPPPAAPSSVTSVSTASVPKEPASSFGRS